MVVKAGHNSYHDTRGETPSPLVFFVSIIMSSDNRKPIGIVLQDKAAGSREILVYPQDTLLPMDGELTAVANKVKLTNGENVGEVTETNAIRAVYWGNELSDTPPDVVKGEEVELTLDEDTGQIYWKSSGRTAKLRSRERKELRASNQEGYQKNIDDSSCYLIRIDTLTTKEIRIQTSMSDGESFAYTILMNPSENKISICDNENNQFGIESDKTRVFLRNKDNTIVNAEKKSLFLGATEDIILKAERQIVLNTPCLTSANDVGSGCMVWNGKSMHLKLENNCVITAPNGIGLHAPVEAETIVSGTIQAEDYCTGKY